MASVVQELLDSIDTFETSMNAKLKKFMYDDIVFEYLHLRKHFKDVYNIALKIDCRADDIINKERAITKFYKNDKAYRENQKLKSN